jgi:hypothetical protein
VKVDLNLDLDLDLIFAVRDVIFFFIFTIVHTSQGGAEKSTALMLLFQHYWSNQSSSPTQFLSVNEFSSICDGSNGQNHLSA